MDYINLFVSKAWLIAVWFMVYTLILIKIIWITNWVVNEVCEGKNWQQIWVIKADDI